MATGNEELLFNERLCARVKQLRAERGWTAEQMAVALGVPADRYRKYENRSPLPQYLMARFCLLTDSTIEELLGEKARPRANAPASQVRARRA